MLSYFRFQLIEIQSNFIDRDQWIIDMTLNDVIDTILTTGYWEFLSCVKFIQLAHAKITQPLMVRKQTKTLLQ